MGNITREISDWMEENLDNRVSADTISSITDRVLPEIKVWKSRSLEPIYPIVWMDAIHYKVTDFGAEDAVTAENSAPMKMDVVYGFNAVDSIRNNRTTIESLLARVAELESKML